MSSLDDLPNLKEMLESLLLPEERSEIAGSASTANREALSKAGITTMMDLITPHNKKLYARLEHATSFAQNIIGRIERLKNDEFRACQLDALFKVPAELQDVIDCKTLQTWEQGVDAIVSIFAHLIINSLRRDSSIRSPFSLTGERDESINIAEPASVFIRNLASKPYDSETNRLDAIRDSMSWFHALSLTAEPDGEGQDSEMTVQMQIGSMMRAMAKLPDCEVLTDRMLNPPQHLKMSSRDASGAARPDIATRPMFHILNTGKDSKIKYETIKALRQPIIIVKEAKRAKTGADLPLEDDSPHYTVQLAMAVYHALLAVLFLDLKGKPFDPKTHESQLHEDSHIFGTYYDEKGAVVFVHFPYYDRKKQGWRFCQMKVAQYEFATSDDDPHMPMSPENARKRAELAIAMEVIREHGRKLYERFMSPEYAEIVEHLTKGATPAQGTTGQYNTATRTPRTTAGVSEGDDDLVAALNSTTKHDKTKPKGKGKSKGKSKPKPKATDSASDTKASKENVTIRSDTAKDTARSRPTGTATKADTTGNNEAAASSTTQTKTKKDRADLGSVGTNSMSRASAAAQYSDRRITRQTTRALLAAGNGATTGTMTYVDAARQDGDTPGLRAARGRSDTSRKGATVADRTSEAQTSSTDPRSVAFISSARRHDAIPSPLTSEDHGQDDSDGSDDSLDSNATEVPAPGRHMDGTSFPPDSDTDQDEFSYTGADDDPEYEPDNDDDLYE